RRRRSAPRAHARIVGQPRAQVVSCHNHRRQQVSAGGRLSGGAAPPGPASRRFVRRTEPEGLAPSLTRALRLTFVYTSPCDDVLPRNRENPSSRGSSLGVEPRWCPRHATSDFPDRLASIYLVTWPARLRTMSSRQSAGRFEGA